MKIIITRKQAPCSLFIIISHIKKEVYTKKSQNHHMNRRRKITTRTKSRQMYFLSEVFLFPKQTIQQKQADFFKDDKIQVFQCKRNSKTMQEIIKWIWNKGYPEQPLCKSPASCKTFISCGNRREKLENEQLFQRKMCTFFKENLQSSSKSRAE